MPVSKLSVRSICDPHDLRRRSASAEAGLEPRGTLARAPSCFRAWKHRGVPKEFPTQLEFPKGNSECHELRT